MLGLLAALGLALPSTSDRSCELLDRVLLATRAQTNCSTISNVDVPGYVGPKWTMAEETCFLYLIGRHSEGAIAEQGPFLGASTIAIMLGAPRPCDGRGASSSGIRYGARCVGTSSQSKN